MTLEAISAAVYNNVVSGLSGISSNPKISMEQLEDEVVAERNQILREYLLQGVLNLDEQLLAINCVPVQCAPMSKCCGLPYGQQALHFEIPPVINITGSETIDFVGSIDRKESYTVYTDRSYKFHKYKKRKAESPYVYIDPTINSNGNIDGYIFNAPLVKYIAVVALFQDPRKLLDWDCCSIEPETYLECGVLSNEIIKRLTAKYIQWYRQYASPVTPNTQQPK